MEDRDFYKVRFEYIDIFDNSTVLERVIDSAPIEMTSEYDTLVNDFMSFLISCGFDKETVNHRISDN